MQGKALYHILKCLLLTKDKTSSRTIFMTGWKQVTIQ